MDVGKITTDRGVDELLERSAELASLEDALASVRRTKRGRFVLVSGEAGIGKTSLVRAFCDRRGSPRVLWGACDPLYTPRPLGPLVDIGEEVPGEFGELVDHGATSGSLVAALADELRRRPPSVVVLEDVHWADEATLDVVRMLARRIQNVPGLVITTYRDDHLDRTHPVRVMLGELPPGDAVSRVGLAPLSTGAVAELAGDEMVDVEELHARTAGNPFFVTEVLAAGGDAVPGTVRDAVLARAARLDEPARRLLDAVAIVPQRAELWLLEAIAEGDLESLEACLASGMLQAERDAVGFRHEVARVAIEEALPPDRRLTLHRRALPALAAAPSGAVDLARLAHHAEAAGDTKAVLRHAPAAAERAAGLGAHREAAEQFARALRFADELPASERAELLDRRSLECYLTGRIPASIDARREALELHRSSGNRLREGDDHRWLSRLAWFEGANPRAEEEAQRAVRLLEALPPSRELAMAYSNVSQLRMLTSDLDGATSWGNRAIRLAEHLGDKETLAHALNNVGTAELMRESLDGIAKLERSLELALKGGFEEPISRGHTNLASIGIAVRKYALGDRHLKAGIAFYEERDLDAWLVYLVGWRARSELEQGHWDAAEKSAAAVLDNPGAAHPSRVAPLTVAGRLRARRGDPDPWTALDEALRLAEEMGELQRLAPVASARAEARWLRGDSAGEIAAETDAALALALEREDRWAAGELLAWRRRAGIADQVEPDRLVEPVRLEFAGDWEAASRCWTEIGCPYEAALALADADDEDALRRSLAALQELGARPAAGHVARKLRERGVRNVRHGPRSAARENPAGLTARELEVLELVAEGLRNAQIAERLVLSEKTVGHHVSAILRKLGVSSRTEASATAARLGIFEK